MTIDTVIKFADLAVRKARRVVAECEPIHLGNGDTANTNTCPNRLNRKDSNRVLLSAQPFFFHESDDFSVLYETRRRIVAMQIANDVTQSHPQCDSFKQVQLAAESIYGKDAFADSQASLREISWRFARCEVYTILCVKPIFGG